MVLTAPHMSLAPVIANAAESGICGADGDNLTWTLDDNGTLTISGTGDMEEFDSYEFVPWRNGIWFNDLPDNAINLSRFGF